MSILSGFRLSRLFLFGMSQFKTVIKILDKYQRLTYSTLAKDSRHLIFLKRGWEYGKGIHS